MKVLLATILLSIVTLYSCGQQTKEYHFPDINMTIKVPKRFIVQDTFSPIIFLDSNSNPIKDLNTIKEMESDLWKGLLIVTSPDEKNTMSVSLVSETPKTGGFKQYYDFSKTMQEYMAKQQMTNYDTASKIYRSNNISIHKFLTNSTKTTPVRYSGIYLAKVKMFFLVIKVDYINEAIGEEFEKILFSSTFK